MSVRLERVSGPEVPVPVIQDRYVRPRYRVKSEKDNFELFVVMPGVAINDVNISLKENRLMVTGTPHREVPKTWRVVHEELVNDPYRLELELHRDIDEEGISAVVEQGVLTLRLPLRAAAKPRLIAVK